MICKFFGPVSRILINKRKLNRFFIIQPKHDKPQPSDVDPPPPQFVLIILVTFETENLFNLTKVLLFYVRVKFAICC